MAIKTIQLSELVADPKAMLNDCADSGDALVVELPDHRMVTIQSLDPADDDELTSELLESNPEFRALVEKSKGSKRKPFVARSK